MASSSATKLLCLFLILGLASPSLATDYIVGGDLGWNLNVDYNAWVSGKVFKVGDVLHFNYEQLVHNVVRVKDLISLQNCITSEYVFIDASGTTSLVLNQVGDFFFTSSISTDCPLKLTLKLTVVAA